MFGSGPASFAVSRRSPEARANAARRSACGRCGFLPCAFLTRDSFLPISSCNIASTPPRSTSAVRASLKTDSAFPPCRRYLTGSPSCIRFGNSELLNSDCIDLMFPTNLALSVVRTTKTASLILGTEWVGRAPQQTCCKRGPRLQVAQVARGDRSMIRGSLEGWILYFTG